MLLNAVSFMGFQCVKKIKTYCTKTGETKIFSTLFQEQYKQSLQIQF